MKKRMISGLVVVLCVLSGALLSNKLNKDKVDNTPDDNGQAVSSLDNNDGEKDKVDTASSKKENERDLDKQKKIDEIEAILNNEMFILVNRDNLLDSSYEPSDLTLSEFEFLDYIETRSLRKEAADAAKKMFDAAKEDGVELLGASGYRSYSIQENIFNSRVNESGLEEASKYTAPPGGSEHQTGLALDILGSDYVYMDDGFESSKSAQWLSENAYKYGFILRYMKGKEDVTGYSYEPWHYRYIGNSDIASYIKENGLTFEEYISDLKAQLEKLNK